MLFGTAGIRGDLKKITPYFALNLGESVAEFSKRRSIDKVVIGRDGRTSSDAVSRAVIAGVLSRGVGVTDVGRVPTPVLAFSCKQSGIMVTASHNPPDNNGMKVFLNHRELYPHEEREVEELMNHKATHSWRLPSVEKIDPLPSYEEALLSYVRRFGNISSPKKVVVDCGNGMGGLITPFLLKKMGCDIITLFEKVSGRFERPPEPSERNIPLLKETVTEESADMGIAHDGDADRINVIDENGRVVPEDSIIALLAGTYVREGDYVITSIDTSFRIDEYVKKKGGHTKRVMLGNLHEGVSIYRAVFAGEPWKHIHTQFGPWIDGIVSSAVLLTLLQDRKASELCSEINQYPLEKINLKTDSPHSILNLFTERIKEFTDIKEVLTISGIRANFEDGSWLLVRPSGTEPKVRIVIEGVTPSRFEMLKKFVVQTLQESKSLYTIVN